MLGIQKLYKLLLGNVVNPMGVVPHSNTTNLVSNSTHSSLCKNNNNATNQAHDSMLKALIAVFGMDKEGRIAKEKACKVVKQLGLVSMEEDEEEEEGDSSFDIDEEDLRAKEVVNCLEEEVKNEKTTQLVLEAFMVFDEDGDGYIDAMEIKRIFACLGLDNGWDLVEIEKMIKVVDLNLDGKVDFHEFKMMMMG